MPPVEAGRPGHPRSGASLRLQLIAVPRFPVTTLSSWLPRNAALRLSGFSFAISSAPSSRFVSRDLVSLSVGGRC